MQLRKWATSESELNYSRVIHWFAFTICGIYAVYHLVWDIPIIGMWAAISGFVALLSIANRFRGQAAVVLYLAFFFTQLMALTLTSYHYGMRGVLLVFPIINALYYIFRSTYATLYALTFIVCCLTAAYQVESLNIIVRSLPALILCLLFSAAYTLTMNKHNSRLNHVANHDALTQIHNRRGFLNWLGRSLAKAKSESSDIALYFFDLDKFKQINDQYGHKVGDQVLVSFSKRLTSSLRSNELIVERGSIQNIGRLSGDEFVLALVDTSNQADVDIIRERILSALDEPIVIGKIAIQLSASIGVSFASDTDYAVDKLLSDADEQMYLTKRQKFESLSANN